MFCYTSRAFGHYNEEAGGAEEIGEVERSEKGTEETERLKVYQINHRISSNTLSLLRDIFTREAPPGGGKHLACFSNCQSLCRRRYTAGRSPTSRLNHVIPRQADICERRTFSSHPTSHSNVSVFLVAADVFVSSFPPTTIWRIPRHAVMSLSG